MDVGQVERGVICQVVFWNVEIGAEEFKEGTGVFWGVRCSLDLPIGNLKIVDTDL